MVTATFAVALLAAGAPERPIDTRWDRPACFAYSPEASAYACLDFDLGADDAGPNRFRPMDFERWVPPAGTAWRGHKAVHLLGGDLDVGLLIAEHPYGRGRAMVRGRSAREAIRTAAARGFSVPVSRAIPLESGRWTEILGAPMRFTTRYHVGDASEYAIGSLQIACRGRGGDDANGRTIELLTHLRGASAVAFVAPGATTFAVGVLEEGGGEGSAYFATLYLYVDPRRVCSVP